MTAFLKVESMELDSGSILKGNYLLTKPYQYKKGAIERDRDREKKKETFFYVWPTSLSSL